MELKMPPNPFLEEPDPNIRYLMFLDLYMRLEEGILRPDWLLWEYEQTGKNPLEMR